MTENAIFPTEANALEAAVEANATAVYVLRLYISGASQHSNRAVTNIRKICDQYLSGRHDFEVVDLTQHPALAKSVDIFAAPTLIKEFPLPVRRFVGDMSLAERVLAGLDLGKTASS